MNSTSPLRPPRIGRGLLSLLLGHGEHWGLVGDFDEMYAERARERGRASARAWYWGQVARFAPACFYYSLLWSKDMFKNHMLIAWRTLRRSKGFSLVNILGLAVGMAGCLLIFHYVRYERGFDRYHADADRIYRVVMHQPGNSASGTEWWVVSPYIMAETLEREVPEVEDAARVLRTEAVVEVRGRKFAETKAYFADPEFLKIFTFPLLQGDAQTALNGPFSVVLTRTAAERYFGRQDPLGRSLAIASGGLEREYLVTGVMADVPGNSHFTFDLLFSLNTIHTLWAQNDTGWKSEWGNNPFKTYVRLGRGASLRAVEQKLRRYDMTVKSYGVKTWTFHLQPLTDIHFRGRYNGELGANGDVTYVYVFTAIAVFLMIIAASNFINLATARASARAREVGVRKVVGAGRRQLIRQFLSEALLLSAVALFAGGLMTALALPTFRRLVGSDLPLGILFEPSGLLFAAALAAGTGILAGLYPAFVLSGFRPARTLRGGASTGPRSASRFRNALVVVQFVISAALITGALVVRGQLDYMRTKKLGYQKDHILAINVFADPGFGRKIGPATREISALPGVKAVARSTGLPNAIGWSNVPHWPGQGSEDQPFFYRLGVDHAFFDLYGLEVVQGRPFSRRPGEDEKTAYVVNEAAVKRMGLKDPVGQAYGFWKMDGAIIGGVKDFHFQPLNVPIAPLGISILPDDRLWRMSIKIDSTDVPGTLRAIEAVWNKHADFAPFQYDFLDDMLDETYKKEQNLAEGFGSFTVVAIFIAGLGLFGLASHSAGRRRKEISIRKILGAGVPGIMTLLAGDFARWVLVAILLAAPVSYFALTAWLRSFAYRIPLSPAAFLFSAVLVATGAALAVSLHLLKAASAKPADSLRNE